MGKGPGGPSLPPAASGLCPSGTPTWGATAWVLNQEPLGEPEIPQLLQQPKTLQPSMVSDPRALSIMAAQEPPVSQHRSGQGSCSLVPAQDPTAPQGCHQSTLPGESPKSWCQRVTLQAPTRPPALPT